MFRNVPECSMFRVLSTAGTLWAVSWFGDYATEIDEHEGLSPVGGSASTFWRYLQLNQQGFHAYSVRRLANLGSGIKDSSKWSAWFVWSVNTMVRLVIDKFDIGHRTVILLLSVGKPSRFLYTPQLRGCISLPFLHS